MGSNDLASLREKLFTRIVCPECKSGLLRDENGLTCKSCRHTYAISPVETPIMLSEATASTAKADWLDGIKTRFKKALPGIYPTFVQLISPVLATGKSYSILLDKLPGEDMFILNLGSGARRLSARVANIDITEYSGVDLVADVSKLPFPDRSVDGIINIALLEHVGTTGDILSESYRVLKPGGYIYSVAPFLQGFHASPHDYYRWTLPGLDEFHAQQGFTMIDSGVRSGPSSALAWVLHEWLSLLLSFNIRVLHHAWYIVLLPFVSLLKLPDLLLARYAEAGNIASAFYYFGQKA
jgi:SAM-dependent methyltransferase